MKIIASLRINPNILKKLGKLQIYHKISTFSLQFTFLQNIISKICIFLSPQKNITLQNTANITIG
jgi:hypothetical protein